MGNAVAGWVSAGKAVLGLVAVGREQGAAAGREAAGRKEVGKAAPCCVVAGLVGLAPMAVAGRAEVTAAGREAVAAGTYYIRMLLRSSSCSQRSIHIQIYSGLDWHQVAGASVLNLIYY